MTVQTVTDCIKQMVDDTEIVNRCGGKLVAAMNIDVVENEACSWGCRRARANQGRAQG